MSDDIPMIGGCPGCHEYKEDCCCGKRPHAHDCFLCIRGGNEDNCSCGAYEANLIVSLTASLSASRQREEELRRERDDYAKWIDEIYALVGGRVPGQTLAETVRARVSTLTNALTEAVASMEKYAMAHDSFTGYAVCRFCGTYEANVGEISHANDCAIVVASLALAPTTEAEKK